MLFKSLLTLTILVLSCSAAVLPTGCASANFTIYSEQYGYLRRYGIYENLDLLEFSRTLPPSYFCFTSNYALEEIESGKCVGLETSTDLQLILTNNCKETWMYNSNEQKLVDSNIGYCVSAWNYPVPPPDVQFVSGLSPCAEWNHIVLIPNPGQKAKENVAILK
ncbi:Hypothetical predicted protein [Paramuricea clavata]|nr:Hypothetical predicted protein [Paramuricea clavata]